MNTTHTLTVRRNFSVPKERIFSAFENAEVLARWFTPNPDISIEVLAYNFEPNGKFRLRYTMPDGLQPVVNGAYEIISPHDRLVFLWVWEAPDPHAGISTIVSIQLIDNDDGTELFLTHDRLPSKEAIARHATGWEAVLNRLEGLFTDQDI